MSNLQVRIGKNIRRDRTHKELSQAELAALLKVDKAYISRIENGQKNLTISSLEKIADALDVSVQKFFN